MNLKTLKDIETYGDETYFMRDLRAEAIKWIFALMSKMSKEKNKLGIHEYIGMIQVLKEFFNISEEE
jgi:hypothetical protein